MVFTKIYVHGQAVSSVFAGALSINAHVVCKIISYCYEDWIM